jgi:hypothetical protein
MVVSATIHSLHWGRYTREIELYLLKKGAWKNLWTYFKATIGVSKSMLVFEKLSGDRGKGHVEERTPRPVILWPLLRTFMEPFCVHLLHREESDVDPGSYGTEEG